ncbi:hypothetical protein PHMEG_00019596 [Phytophthora megakarya]|uniref:Uncharacterized protein n=1 Tax=Phytophthora megakarya TaxID=4795 RepID=A0A225VSE7_9STRA|nr:hypothetical protein PHMEG_00019596 [Phytophthora megakarya]
MYALLDYITERLSMTGVDPTTLGVLTDSAKKIELFLGHRIRVRNQQLALQRAADEVKARCDFNKFSDEAIVILDFKMKLEPLYFREKTVDHYGKRGMSWHGALVRYWTFVDEKGEAVERDCILITYAAVTTSKTRMWSLH